MLSSFTRPIRSPGLIVAASLTGHHRRPAFALISARRSVVVPGWPGIAGTLLIPCSGQLHGIIGSVGLATDWHENKVLTNHILRIVPKSKPAIRIGYLQAVLSHPLLGRPRVLKGAFGSSVPELSPDDVSGISVPRLPTAIEDKIADMMEEAVTLRTQADELEKQIADEAEGHLTQFLSTA